MRFDLYLYTAEVTPATNIYTKSVGESVELIVACHDQNVKLLRWKHNNGSIISAWNGLSVVEILNVRKADEGIYECFVENRRELGLHAIMRLVVRGKLNQILINIPKFTTDDKC